MTQEHKTIVVVEDEKLIRKNLVENLRGKEFTVYEFENAEQAINSAVIQTADAVVMDINLPGINGFQATKLIKHSHKGTPVLILTVFGDLEHRMKGFEMGADDYLIKPFFMEELVARLTVIMKRYALLPGAKNFYSIHDLSINTKSKEVNRGKSVIRLTATEFNLLALLAAAEGEPVSKEEIRKSVWKGRYSVGDNTIEVYINLLRNKIDRPFTRKLIQTKAGFGYLLSAVPQL